MPVGLYRTTWSGGAGQYGTDWGAGQATTGSGAGAAACGARIGAAGAQRYTAPPAVVIVGGAWGAAGLPAVPRRAGLRAGARCAGASARAAGGSGAMLSAAQIRLARGGSATAGAAAWRCGASAGASGRRTAFASAALRAGALRGGAGVGVPTRLGAAGPRAGGLQQAAGARGALNTDHVREQIRDAVVGWMGALPTVQGRAYSSRVFPIQSGQFPAILVYTVDDRVIEETMGLPALQVRELELGIQIYARSATDLDGALDDIAALVEARMAIDHNVNRLAQSTLLTGTDIAMVEGETAIGTCTLTYLITYVIDPALPFIPI